VDHLGADATIEGLLHVLDGRVGEERGERFKRVRGVGGEARELEQGVGNAVVIECRDELRPQACEHTCLLGGSHRAREGTGAEGAGAVLRQRG
jgi:hypothetical protein